MMIQVSVSLPVISTDEGLNLKLGHETSLMWRIWEDQMRYSKYC